MEDGEISTPQTTAATLAGLCAESTYGLGAGELSVQATAGRSGEILLERQAQLDFWHVMMVSHGDYTLLLTQRRFIFP